MLEYAKETTAPIPPDATDEEQPFTQKCKSRIADDFGENKTNDELEDLYRRMRQLADPNYLNAVSMPTKGDNPANMSGTAKGYEISNEKEIGRAHV